MSRPPHPLSLRSRLFASARLGLGAALVLAASGPAAGQGFDVTATDIHVTQAIQLPAGGSPLAAGRTTYVRALMSTSNQTGAMIDGYLRMFVDGVEHPESPYYSSNGPLSPPGNSSLGNIAQTLNFVVQPPASSDVVFTVVLNALGPNHEAEVDVDDNSFTSPPYTFTDQAVGEIAYAPIDYRPSGGGTPNLPDPALIEPGVGDNFIQGIYPSKDWFYHRTDAPSKLWTNSLSGSGSGLLNSLNVDIAMMSPRPDFLYGWVPGGLPYNGVAFINGDVSMGNTQSFKHQRTFAHEIGHNFGLSHNSFNINQVGVDVEHHLNITQGLNIAKGSSLNDIMVPGLNTNQAWVRPGTWQFFFTHSTFNLPGPEGSSAGDAPSGGPVVLITGRRIRKTGALEVSHVLELPAGEPTPSLPQTAADLRVRVHSTGGVQELWTACAGVEDCADASDSATDPIDEAFLVVLPVGGEVIERLSIDPANGVGAGVQLQRSASAPTVQFASADGAVPADGRVEVSWSAADADGDELAYYLRYTPDGSRWVPLATGIGETSYEVDLADLPAFVDGQGRFQVFASDGLRTASALSPTLSGSGAIWPLGGNAPWVEIVTPDDGKSYRRAARVVLHSSGWDLEDRGLTGSSIAWSSDVDGALGTGRLLTVSSLSVGTHVLTVTATDSSGMTDTDTATITITDRELPSFADFPVVYCTAKTTSQFCIPFLSLSGLPSASSTSSFDIEATLVTNDKLGLLFYGVNGPTNAPFFGGTLCVAPPLRRQLPQFSGGGGVPCNGTFATDFNAIIQGGGDPTLVAGQQVNAQYWFRDTGHPDGTGVGLTDAGEFEIIP